MDQKTRSAVNEAVMVGYKCEALANSIYELLAAIPSEAFECTLDGLLCDASGSTKDSAADALEWVKTYYQQTAAAVGACKAMADAYSDLAQDMTSILTRAMKS